MSRRIAAGLGLIAFALCLVQGLVAENSFGTVIWRAIQALVVTLVVGGILGVMFEKMLGENLGKLESVEKTGAEVPTGNR